MKLIGSAFARDLNDTAAIPAEFGADITGRNPEFLDGILRRDQRVHIVLGDVGPHAVDKEQALSAERATDLIISVGDRLRICAHLGRAAVCHGTARSSASRYN